MEAVEELAAASLAGGLLHKLAALRCLMCMIVVWGRVVAVSRLMGFLADRWAFAAGYDIERSGVPASMPVVVLAFADVLVLLVVVRVVPHHTVKVDLLAAHSVVLAGSNYTS